MTTETLPDLTPRQLEILQWIHGYVDSHEYGPTIREIGHSFGWTVNGVMSHLRPMRRKGVIDWLDGQSRTLRITALGKYVVEMQP